MSQAGRADLTEIRAKVDLYLSVQRFDAAEKLLRATLADHGPLANIHNLLGVTFHKQSRFVDAIKEFQQAMALNSEFIEAGLNLAATFCDLSRYDEAQEVFHLLEKQVSGKKKQPSLVLGRIANLHVRSGQSYEDTGLYTEAISEYKKGLALYDRMPDVKMALVKLYIKTGQHDKAKQECEEVVKLSPQLPDGHTWLGILYYRLGRRDLAKRHWEIAQQCAPGDLASRAYLKLARGWSSEAP